MLKRFTAILTASLMLGTVDMSAQNFLNALKKQGEKFLKETAEQVITNAVNNSSSNSNSDSSSSQNSNTSSSNNNSNSQTSAASSKTSSSATTSLSSATTSSSTSKAKSGKSKSNEAEPFPELVNIPLETEALFEPLGGPTVKGTVYSPVTTPATSESAQHKWVLAQPALCDMTNQRLVEELKMYEKWVSDKKGQTDAFAVRYSEATHELGYRLEAINQFVECVCQAHGDEDVEWVRKQNLADLARIISGNYYRYTINSSLVPLKSGLNDKTLAYFEAHGGLENATTSAKTKWLPFGKIITVPTSIEGVTGELTIDGYILVQGTFYRLHTNTMTASILETDAETIEKYTDYVIPDYVYGYSGRMFPVTEIRPGAFYGNGMKTLTLPKTLKKIGNNAFACLSVTRIDIPDGVEVLEAACFHSSSTLLEVYVPDSVTEIGGGCWADCKNLTTVRLPKNVSHFDIGQFQECPSLVNVNLPENLTEIKEQMFDGCTGLKNIVIPDSVTKICDNAFFGCKGLETVKFSDNLTEIGEDAFNGCSSLKSLELPESLTTIREDAFTGCTKLTTVTIPKNVTTIETFAFNKCTGLKSATISSAFKDKVYMIFFESGIAKRDTLIDYSYFNFVE